MFPRQVDGRMCGTRVGPRAGASTPRASAGARGRTHVPPWAASYVVPSLAPHARPPSRPGPAQAHQGIMVLVLPAVTSVQGACGGDVFVLVVCTCAWEMGHVSHCHQMKRARLSTAFVFLHTHVAPQATQAPPHILPSHTRRHAPPQPRRTTPRRKRLGPPTHHSGVAALRQKIPASEPFKFDARWSQQHKTRPR